MMGQAEMDVRRNPQHFSYGSRSLHLSIQLNAHFMKSHLWAILVGYTQNYMNYLWWLNWRLHNQMKRSFSAVWWHRSRYVLLHQMVRRWTSCGRGMGCILVRFGTSPHARRAHTAKYDTIQWNSKSNNNNKKMGPKCNNMHTQIQFLVHFANDSLHRLASNGGICLKAG